MTNQHVVKNGRGKLITVEQLKEVFKSESELWKNNFFTILEENKIAHTKTGDSYELTGMILASGLGNEPDIEGEVIKTDLKTVMTVATSTSSGEMMTFQKGKNVIKGTFIKSVMSHGAEYCYIALEDGKKQYINSKYKV